MTRHRTLLAAPLVAGWLVAAPSVAQNVTLVSIATDLDSPIHVTHAGDGSGRLFIVEQQGRIRIFDGSQVLAVPFLDITGLVSCCGERGLLSVAFHPDYESNGFFYVDYTNNSLDTVVARYKVSAGNSNIADPTSAFTLLTIDQPQQNHNGGQLQFGPDGYLYIASGDGGGAGDPDNNGQSLNTMLGKMLRIDVDTGSPYGIPPDNPYVGSAGLDEIWANGLRNPWRFTFDRQNGDMFIGDVGQNSFEEIDFQPAASTGCENYGWRLMEASSCFNPPSNCNQAPPSGCNPSGDLVLPILEYAHENNPCDSVTGGYRYRGSEVPAIDSMYLYADFCRGTLWAAQEFVHEFIGPPVEVGGPPPPPGPDPIVEWIPQVLMETGMGISSFGEDADGELYVVDIGGTVFQIASAVALSPASGSYPETDALDMVITVNVPDARIDAVEMALDGEPWKADFGMCAAGDPLAHGAQSLICPDLGRLLEPGPNEISVGVLLDDGRRFDASVTWDLTPRSR